MYSYYISLIKSIYNLLNTQDPFAYQQQTVIVTILCNCNNTNEFTIIINIRQITA